MIYFDLDQWQWGSRTNYPDHTKHPFTMDKVVIHYGGTTYPGDGQEFEMDRLRRWQRYHIDGRGWTDIAYNFAVGNSGLSYRLRGINRSGAQTGDYEFDGVPENHEGLAIVWIGGVPHEPSEAAYATMGRLARESEMQTIIGHSHIKGSTECPGDFWRAWIAAEGWKIPGQVGPDPVEGDHEMKTVRYGDGSRENPDKAVVMAQAGATAHGFKDKNTIDKVCSNDGIFRSGTEEQMKDFQEFAHIVIDGQVGPETWAALEA